jgi:hypothetical protein
MLRWRSLSTILLGAYILALIGCGNNSDTGDSGKTAPQSTLPKGVKVPGGKKMPID